MRDLLTFCERNKARVLAALPWIAAEFAGQEDFPSMFCFIRRFSGARLYVSRDLGRFRAAIGIDISEALHRQILRGAGATGIVDIPSAWGVFLALRRVAVIEAVALGTDRRDTARRFGVSERALRSLATT